MPTSDEILLILVPSIDDAPLFSDEYQAELEQFENQAQGAKQIRSINASAGGSGAGQLGEFIFVSGASLVTTLTTLGVAWIKAKGRNDRKLKLKIGDITAEASTVKEIDALVKLAQEHIPKKKSTK